MLMMKSGQFQERQSKMKMGESIMQKETLLLKCSNWLMKGFSLLMASTIRSVSDAFRNNHNNDIDLMADVDDQRAHHFGAPEDFD